MAGITDGGRRAPKRTLRERLAEALTRRGCIAVESRSKKFLTFKHPDRPYSYFVGAAGALRRGKTASDSVSLNKSALRFALLQEVPE